MDDLLVKSVDVMGDFITAAKDHDGNVWAGVRWICDALDMTEGQMKRQIKNIKKDMLFLEGGSNQIPLPTGQGVQEVFCIRNDFIPLWLAKINITQKTREERPEFAKKLLEYQLKAKDILAAAFLPNQGGDSTILRQQIQTIAKGTEELYQRVDKVSGEVQTVKQEIEALRDDLPLFPSEADEISNAAKRKGVEVLGGKDSNAYKDRSLQHKVYTNIYANLKYNFTVGSYKAIKRGQREIALKIVEEYEPPFFLAEQIKEANAQQRLDV